MTATKKTSSAQLVVFLQNAWSPVYAGGEWPRRSWLAALERSRSGQRLRLMLDGLDCCHNTTPIVGPTPSSIVPPNVAHIRAILCASPRLRLVIACGKQAAASVAPEWAGSLLVIPHPAYRV